ncbi:hypothetical protein DUNSADRAFT_1838 [Dunaliella salina]|uniref:Uncharacterized protein n=1 Tax=Dunaliella salina TaxID=3046 RepID=A0ABQ7FWX2_DUNSA|nr:hypothetical protein DUNSADRAFT_1838 [Dunaliella salina]|eukprot:KAF5826867.1 hypothetical protein DUNSADRAFT_1838 [Dunaliella salina]
MAPSGGASTNSIRVLGIVPEKHLLHSEVLSGLHSQFHSQASQSPQSLETTAIRAPCSLGPLPLSSPSSLSRTQFLVAAQAATLPCFPSSSKSDGGVVVDRVLVQGGKGEHIWAALTGRAKAQRITTKRRQHGWKRALTDPENYTLCANARLRARPGSCARLSAELQPRNASEEVLEQQQQDPPALGQSIAGVLRRSTVRASSQLQHRLGHAELRAGLAYNQRLQHCKGYSTVPLSSSIDLCTPHQLSTPLQFRAGLYHATAPAEPTAGESSPCPLRTSVHAQGGLALQGERNLWSGNPAARRIKLYKQQQQRQQQQQQQQRRSRGTPGTAPTSASYHPTSMSSPTPSPAGAAAAASAASPPLTSHSSSVGAPAHAAAASGSSSLHHTSGREGARPRSNTLGPHNPIRQYLQRLLPQGHHAGSGFGEEDEEEHGGRGQGEWGSSKASGWLAPDADQVQESVIDATQSTSRLREDVQSLTEWVTSGAFSEQLQRRVGPTVPSKGKAPWFESNSSRTSTSTSSSSSSDNQPPWSSLLGPPHFRLAGMFGACMLAPLGPSQSGRGDATMAGNPVYNDAEEGSSGAWTPHQPLQPSLESLKGSISHLAKQSTYGLDLVLPGMSGFGRLVAWYAPGRKEGMLELRLF